MNVADVKRLIHSGETGEVEFKRGRGSVCEIEGLDNVDKIVAGVWNAANRMHKLKYAAILTVSLFSANCMAFLPEIEDVRVAPLIETRWDQSNWGRKSSGGMVFNKDTPGNGVCGCGVTAAAQLMRYYRYPDFPMEQMSNDCVYHDKSSTYPREVLHLTTVGGMYEWAKMPCRYDMHPELDDVERGEIAKLTSDIGISFGVSYMYRDYETNTDKETLMANLKRIWKYNAGYYIWPTVPQGDQLPDWVLQAICGSLNARRPVIVWCHRPETAEKAGDGHTFLLDGYGYHNGRIYIHANCGWSGKSDGWYAFMDDIVSDYNTLRYIAFNIHPSQSGQILSGRVTDGDGRPIFGATVSIAHETNGSLINALTDEHGIYFFVVDHAASFRMTAEKDGVTASKSSVQMSMPTTLASDDTNSKILLANAQTIGNRFNVDFELEIPTAQRRYSVRFDLGRIGRRVGGGQLAQSVHHGELPVVPEVSGTETWRFAGWNHAVENAVRDMVYRALFLDSDGDPMPDCYVDVHAPPAGDGATPETAFTSLLNGLSQVPTGGVVSVAAGVYPPLKFTSNKPMLIKSSSGKLQTILDGGGTNRVVHLGTNYVGCVNTVMRGFTIQNGYRSGENVAGAGGYAGTYIDCNFKDNVIEGSGGAVYGAVLVSCRVFDNFASGSGGGAGRCTMTNSLLFNNVALGSGGGAFRSSLVGCNVVSNSANYGGGVYAGTVDSSALMYNVSNRSGGGAYRSRMANSAVAFNSSTNTGTYGGGCYECTNLNCTVYSNSVTAWGGGAYNCISTNCIFWGNVALSGDSDVRSGTSVNCLSSSVLAGVNNKVGNPMMYAPDTGDFRLRPKSPCIDAGITVAEVGENDLIGHQRVQGSAVDIGACEGSELTTLSTEVEVPYSWIDRYPALLDMCCGDYEMVAKLKTGKGFDSNGNELCVWHDYLVGTDPTDPDDKFKITFFRVKDGDIEITWSPDLNENHTKSVRVYKLMGSNNLQNWHDVGGNKMLYRFFKVEIEIPRSRSVQFPR